MPKQLMQSQNKGMLAFMSYTSDHLNPLSSTWLDNEGLRQIFKAFHEAGHEARVVGGAVRDALRGRPVSDIDLAVNVPPETMCAVLKAAGMKVVPTGLDHGTVTVVVDHKSFEITSLRRDIETDGRHAKVTYTENWRDDAARRDFTFNALYVDAKGHIYDYFQGREDLAQGRVHFIGNAAQRIREDVLRILRFFRFFAWFGEGDPDKDGLKACQDLAVLLPHISAERVGHEIKKLLAAPNPYKSLVAMQQSGVLPILLPNLLPFNSSHKLFILEEKHGVRSSPLRRLLSFMHHKPSDIEDVVKRLKLSNREAKTLQNVAFLSGSLLNRLDSSPLSAILYDYGSESVLDAFLIQASHHPEIESQIPAVLSACSSWEKPVFPLRGEDLLKINLKPGPEIGQILRQTEIWWVQKGFHPDHKACLAQAQSLANHSASE